MTNQGKVLTKNKSRQTSKKINQGRQGMFLELSLSFRYPWLKMIFFVAISFYRNIVRKNIVYDVGLKDV